MLLGILALIAVGAFACFVIKVTFNWIRDKIKEKLAKKNAKKVFVSKVKEMVDECENEMTLDEMEQMSEYTHVMAEVDNNGEVQNVDLIKDTSSSLDKDVERMLGKQGQVVISK